MKLQGIPGTLPPWPRTKFSLLCNELLFFLVDFTFSGNEIDLVKRNDLCSEVEFIAGPEEEEGGNRDVCGDERVCLERDEGVVAFEEGDDCGCDESEV